MKYPFSYTLSPNFEPKVFWAAVSKLDSSYGFWKQEIWEDPLDGDLFKSYSSGCDIIKVRCDWDVGAVYIDSTVDLNHIFDLPNINEGRT